MRTVSRRHVPAQDESVFQLTWYSFPSWLNPVEPGEDVNCFFRTPYSPKTPPAL